MFTVEQKREHVLAYLAAPYGSRGRYLGEHGVSYRQFRVWRAQVFADTLEYGLVPRGGLAVTAEQSAFVARLRAELDALREQVAQQQAEHEQALAAKAAELAVQVKAVDALGKAYRDLASRRRRQELATAGPRRGPAAVTVAGGVEDVENAEDAEDAEAADAAVSVVMVTVALVSALIGAGLSQRRALAVAGLSRSSWHYRSRPRPRVAVPVPHTARRAASWLDPAERERILDKLKAAFVCGWSVYQAYYEALDAKDPVASLSSWYRIARQLEPQRPVRRRARHRASAIPSLVASAPLQVWSWDITKLKGPYIRVTYELYLVVDVFSRLVVAWRVEDRECDDLAKDMFETAFRHHRAHPTVVHSDGGPSMTSNTLTGLFQALGVEVSRNRPRVSNDNPYSESLFKTAKYAPTYPAYFTSIEQARQWVTEFVHWYNHEHRHSSLEGHTPATVHDGSWISIHQQRVATMARLHAEHPERFTKPSTIKAPMAKVAINQEISTDRLQTG